MQEELYRQNILEHYRYPHNKRVMSNSTFHGEGMNRSCGDMIDIYMKLKGKEVIEVSFSGDGCAVSIASVSMLTDKIKGKTLNEIKAISPGDIYNMLGVKISQGRVNCALLGYEALQHALKNK